MQGTLLNYSLKVLNSRLDRDPNLSLPVKYAAEISDRTASTIQNKSYKGITKSTSGTELTNSVNKMGVQNETRSQSTQSITTTQQAESSLGRLNEPLYGNFHFEYLNSLGEKRVFNFSLLPAIEMNLRVNGSSAAVPEVKPGILFRTSRNIKTFKIPGSEPVYQNLGIAQKFISIVGSFIGTESVSPTGLTSRNSGILYDSINVMQSNSQEAAALFDSEVIQKGRSTKLVLKARGGTKDKEISLEINCIPQSIRTFVVRSDRAYYAIDLIPIESGATVNPKEETSTAATVKSTREKELELKAKELAQKISDRRATLFNTKPELKKLIGTDALNTELLKDTELQKLESEYKTVNSEYLSVKGQGLSSNNIKSQRKSIEKDVQKNEALKKSNVSSSIPEEQRNRVLQEQSKASINSEESRKRLYKLDTTGSSSSIYSKSTMLPDNSFRVSRWSGTDFRPSLGTGPGAIERLPEDWGYIGNTSGDSGSLWDGNILSEDFEPQVQDDPIDYPLDIITTGNVATKTAYKTIEEGSLTDEEGFTWRVDGTIEAPNGTRYIPTVGVVRLDNRIVIPEERIATTQRKPQQILSLRGSKA